MLKTEALPYLIDSLKIVAQSPLSFVALISFVIAVGLWIVFKPGQKYSTFTILGSFAMFVFAIVFLSISVVRGFSEPKRVYYVGKDTTPPSGGGEFPLHVGVFRKMNESTWDDVSSRGENYHYSFKYAGQMEGLFFLDDELRNIRLEINTTDRKIYWEPRDRPERYMLYDIVAIF